MTASLRGALEQELKNLPVMSYDDGYRVQALPKATLLDLLARHPAEPVGVSDEAVEQLHAQVVTEFRRHGQYTLGLARAALEAAAPLMGATPRPTLDRAEVEEVAADILGLISPVEMRANLRQEEIEDEFSDWSNFVRTTDKIMALMGATPVASRERIAEALYEAMYDEEDRNAGVFGGQRFDDCERIADDLFIAGVFNKPPTREQISEALLAAWIVQSELKVEASPVEHCRALADAVLALMGGAEK